MLGSRRIRNIDDFTCVLQRKNCDMCTNQMYNSGGCVIIHDFKYTFSRVHAKVYYKLPYEILMML